MVETRRPVARLAAFARKPSAVREILLLVALYVAYSGGRMLGSADIPAAYAHARTILHLEDLAGINVESTLNAAVTAVAPLGLLASYWYAVLHYVVTPAVLVWLYRRNRAAYALWRTILVVGTAIGLIGFWLLPTAPPRLLAGSGFTDTLAHYSSYGWWGTDASAPRGLGGLTNQFAAMPSLHVGWALWVALVLWRHAGPRLRIAGVVHAVGTTAVVVVTANHYVLDAVAGMLVIAFSCVVVQGARVASNRGGDSAIAAPEMPALPVAPVVPAMASVVDRPRSARPSIVTHAVDLPRPRVELGRPARTHPAIPVVGVPRIAAASASRPA